MNTGWTFSDWLQYAFSFALVIGLLLDRRDARRHGEAGASDQPGADDRSHGDDDSSGGDDGGGD